MEIIITLLIVGLTFWAMYKKSVMGSKPQSQSERDKEFLDMIRRETLDKQSPPSAMNSADSPQPLSQPIKQPETAVPPPITAVPDKPKAVETVIKEDAQPVSEYRKGTIGATVEEIMKKADSSGVTVSLETADGVMNLTDKELISLTSLMLKRAVTACEKGEKKNIEFSAHKSVSDVVLSCKFPDIKNSAIIESRAILKFTAEKIKGIFVFSDNGIISSEQAIIPFSSIKY